MPDKIDFMRDSVALVIVISAVVAVAFDGVVSSIKFVLLISTDPALLFP